MLLRAHRTGQEEIHEPGFRGRAGSLLHSLVFFLAHHMNGDIEEIADHGFHIAAHVTHFREFRGFHLYKGSSAQFGQTARYFGLAAARGTHHDDVLGRNLIAQFLGQLLSAPPVADSHRHHAFGFFLTYDILIEFSHYLMRLHCAHINLSAGRTRKISGRTAFFFIFTKCTQCMCTI